MKTVASAVLALSLVLAAPAGFAQDAVVEESTEAQTGPQGTGWVVPAVIGVIVLCVLLCGEDDPAPAPTLIDD